jgi:hypothetical protein
MIWVTLFVLLKSDLDVHQNHLFGSFRCDQIRNSHSYEYGHSVVLLKSRFNVQPTHLSLLMESSCLAPAQDVTKFISVGDINLLTLCFAR